MSEAEAKPTPSNRKFYLLVAVFLLAAVGVGMLSLKMGAASVAEWKAEMKAKGERLTVAELLRAHPPAATNRLAELTALTSVLDRKLLLDGAFITLLPLGNGHARPVWMGSNFTMLANTVWNYNRLVSADTNTYQWEQLAARLAEEELTLAQLRAMLVIPDRDVGWNFVFGTSYPKASVAKRTIQLWLEAAHALHLHSGQPLAADADLTTLLQLLTWHSEDFTLEAQLFRASMGVQTLHVTWSALQAPGVSAEQLAAYQTRWEKLTVLPALTRALEFQRAGMSDMIEHGRQGGFTPSIGGPSVTRWDRLAFWTKHYTWMKLTADGDQLFYLRHIQGQLEALRRLAKEHSWTVAEPLLTTNAAELRQLDTWQGQLKSMSTAAAMDFRDCARLVTHYEAHRELTIAALALERFRRKHGRHPDSLAQLMPEFLPAVPVDWMDGQPLRYRLNTDGTFELWSVGDDFKDDGGDASGPPVNMRRNDIWEGRDAVWPRLPP
ncbi:MAG: hypothetical protein ABMA26_18425 [Limisphaerales bacterium]